MNVTESPVKNSLSLNFASGGHYAPINDYGICDGLPFYRRHYYYV